MKLLAAAVLLLLPLAALAQHPSSYRSTALGITFPATLAGIPLTDSTDFEKDTPGLGVSVTYQTSGFKADIYIYNFRLPQIPPGLDNSDIRAVFQSALREISVMEQRGTYKNVKILIPDEKTLIGSTPMLHCELTLDLDGKPRISHIYLGALKNQFLKIRCTYLTSDGTQDKKLLQNLLTDLAKLLDSPR